MTNTDNTAAKLAVYIAMRDGRIFDIRLESVLEPLEFARKRALLPGDVLIRVMGADVSWWTVYPPSGIELR